MSGGEQNGGDKPEDPALRVEVWPEVAWAEVLAQGAALKWASAVFSRPEHLERLGQYRKRESQRTTSIHSRLKSVVQSYLEGVGWGLRQLQESRVELGDASRTLQCAVSESCRHAEVVRSMDTLRELSCSHYQLLATVSNLPRLYSGKEIWAVVSSSLALARQNPTPFVSAVRIVEREEAVDRALLEERGGVAGAGGGGGGGGGGVRPLPPGRPRCWRERFFQVLEEAVSSRFRSVSYMHTRGPGLAGHLSALQHAITTDLATVRHLLEQCVPPHYRLTGAYLRASHQCLQAHLALVSSWELESGEIFAVLNWVLHIYNSPDMMGEPELVAEMERQQLGPLISLEALDQLQKKYVQSVRKRVSEWMHKALEMLEENVRVALMIGESLRDQTIQMGLYEMENLLNKQQSSRAACQFSRTPPNPMAALDRAVRRACRLVMDQLLLELQPVLQGLLSRGAQGNPATPLVCRVLERHLELYARVRPPCRQRLQEEAQWLLVVEYVRALLHKRTSCRSAGERLQLAQRIGHDDQQLRELFTGLEGEGSVPEVDPLALLPVLADFIRLKDPCMLSLEVSGIVTKYPDISEEHVCVLLDIRGDVSRDVRASVLDVLEHSPPALPAGYRPIFTDILVPTSTMPFCLPTVKCA
ncbi:hypothetical protein CRUP_007579 [Coryphaenoides rupestris]|nr:hypothetical protein CRUP_007579 [Coryphaenoides rupestris]